MMLALLVWFLVSPHLPGASADALRVAHPLRYRVVQLLFPSVLRAVAAWLVGCAAGTLFVVLAVVARAPAIAVLGPTAAAVGASAGVAVLLAAVFRERMWVRALGLPADWRGPWLAGKLARRMEPRPLRPLTVPWDALTPVQSPSLDRPSRALTVRLFLPARAGA
jgi:hypothetical protein